jgi:capsular exopolysaccharide synthesis family protein
MAQKKSELIDFSKLFSTYASKWYWFVISVLACCTLGYLYSRTIQPRYAVHANIMLSENSTSTLMAGGISGMSDLLGGNSSAEDEAEIAGSHTVLRDVVKKLELNRNHKIKVMPMVANFVYKDYPVDVVPDASIDLDTLRTKLVFSVKVSSKNLADITVIAKGEKIEKLKQQTLPHVVQTPYGRFTVTFTPAHVKDSDGFKTIISLSGYDVAAEDLAENVNIGLSSKHSSIINLQMIDSDIDYAKDVLNAIVDTYNQRSVAEQNVQTSATAQLIEDRLTVLKTDLDLTEKELEKYKIQQGITNIEVDGTVRAERLNESENQMMQAEMTWRLAKLNRDMVKASAKDNSLIPLQGNELTDQLITEYNNVLFQRTRMEQSAKPDNTALRQLNEQITTLRNNLLKSMDAYVQNCANSLNELKGIYAKSSGEASTLPSLERNYRALARQQTIKEQIYLYLLQKQEESAIMLANNQPKGQIVDHAYAKSDNLATSSKMILLMAFVIGLCIPPLILYLKKLMRHNFTTVDEVTELVSVPVLGEICKDNSGSNLVVRQGSTASVVELFRLIRVNLQFILKGSENKVVLVSSNRSGEGKSFVALNMAASFALLGKRTLLIGMDIRKPRLAQYLEMQQTKPGLTEYLSSTSLRPDDIIYRDAKLNNLDVILAGPVPPNPAEMLSAENVDQLFTQLRDMYDYIIVDSAPTGLVSDTLLLARIADATIYVCRSNYTTISDLRYVESLYSENRMKHMSLVVNGTETRHGGYGYGEDKQNK